MTPLIIVPLAVVAMMALRAGKSDKGAKAPVATKPAKPTTPLGPVDGPCVEPARPGGPKLPTPKPRPPTSKPTGELFIGHGPRSPEDRDPSPVVLAEGIGLEDIERHPLFEYNLFIDEKCDLIVEGPRWFLDTFLPMAKYLVKQDPEGYHDPIAVIHELLIAPSLTGDGTQTTPQTCMGAWPDVRFSGETLSGTLSGNLVFFPGESMEDGFARYESAKGDYEHAFPGLDEFLENIAASLDIEQELAEIFGRDWPTDTGVPFDQHAPTGS